MIWTPAKMMKKTPQTNREQEAAKRPPPKDRKDLRVAKMSFGESRTETVTENRHNLDT